LPALVLNLRGLDLSQPGAAWLTEPVLLRSIGSVYDPTVPDQWFYEHDLPVAFDALIYIDQTWATRLLR
jgi:erythromycin esterase-like protein